MQDSLNVENTPVNHRREHNVSGTIQASFLAKFKAAQNKLGQKGNTAMYIYVYVYIYIYIYIYCMVKILGRKLKRSVYQLVLRTRS